MTHFNLLVLALIVGGAVVSIEAKSWSSLEQQVRTRNARLPLFSQPRRNDDLPDYYTEIAIGTPPQKIRVKIDTTGYDFWVISSKCTKNECVNHARYDSSKSRSYKKDGRTSGSQSSGMSGFLSSDTVHLGDLSIPNVTFGESINPGPGFQYYAYDAVMGVNFLQPQKGETDSVMSKLAASKILPVSQVFFHIDVVMKEPGHIGEIVFGDHDAVDAYGAIVGVPAGSDGFSFKMDHLSVFNTSTTFSNVNTKIVNWVNHVVVPYGEAAKLNKALGATEDPYHGSGLDHYWSFADCKYTKYPDIIITILGHEIYMASKVYMKKSSDGKCRSIFEGLENVDFWQINYQFLSAVYTAFDHDSKLLHFAQSLP